MPELTATDRLRALLDERGVEWQSKPELIISGIEKGTEFDAADGRLVRAVEALDGTICLSHITPEQAIAATLGAGTCVPVLDSERDNQPYLKPRFVCSECGCQLTESRLGKVWQNYCPNCGRRIGAWDRVRKAEADNAKLREERDTYRDLVDCMVHPDIPDQLAAENAKLREELADTPKCEACDAMLDCDECLRADGSHKERRRLSAENAKLQELFNETAIRLVAANEAAGGGFMDARYCELLESHGIEVGEWASS